MSLYLILIAAIAVLVAIVAALVFKNRADNQAHEAERQKTVADAVNLKNDHRDRLDTKLEQLHETQRHETIVERAQLGRRDDLDNDWSNGMPDSAGDTAGNSGAAETGQTGAAVHQVERADLS